MLTDLPARKHLRKPARGLRVGVLLSLTLILRAYWSLKSLPAETSGCHGVLGPDVLTQLQYYFRFIALAHRPLLHKTI